VEHRYGKRYAAQIPVRLRTRGGVIAQGHICSVSISGVAITTELPLRLGSHVQLQVLGTNRRPASADALEGQVVRRTADGFGIEWCEFGTEAARALLRNEVREAAADRLAAQHRITSY
jgi:hypothetical protein